MLKQGWKGMLAALGAVLALSGCGGGGGGGGGGSTVPTIASATPGDSQVTLNWEAPFGMYYWVWWIQSTLPVTIGPNGNAVGSDVNAQPPYVVSGLINDFPYSFAINAHSGDPNAPGGPQSNSMAATPRFAGGNWIPCATTGSTCPAGAPTLYGVTFGDNAGILASDNGSLRYYLAVGSAGRMYASMDAKNWNAIPPQAPCTPSGGGALRATDYGWGTFVVVGDNGTVCFSGLTYTNPTGLGLAFTPNYLQALWYPATTLPPGTGSVNFYAVNTNQNGWAAIGGAHVAVGSKGTIMWSGDGQNWFSPIFANTTTSDLYDVAFNFCAVPFWSWVAVGANGTIIATADATGGTNWTTTGINVATTQPLRTVACTPNSTPVALPGYPPLIVTPLFLAAGDGGVLLSSVDGINWIAPTNFKIDNVPATVFPVNIRRMTYGTQFVAVGDGGAVFTSLDGVNWISQKSNAGSTNLYAVTQPEGTTIPNGFMGAVSYGYLISGDNGFTAFGQ